MVDSHSNKEEQPDAPFAFAEEATLYPSFVPSDLLLERLLAAKNDNVRCDEWRLFKV